MNQTVKPETTAAIILGASYWPEYAAFGKSANPVFANSAAAIREYLTDPLRFGLRPDRVKNLFDSPATAPEIHQLIAKFLEPLSSKPDSGGLTDLLVYYVGHGGFTGPDRRYFFAIVSTVEGYEGSSGLRAADLASTLKTAARHARKYLILDCCFAAAAFSEFQPAGGVAQLAGAQVAEELPPRGTALLCAASKTAPAIAPVSSTYTMFSGALREVLLNGSKTGRLHMSLQEIGKEIKNLLRERSPDDWVRPQVLSPDAAEGDVAEVALFPNPAVGTVELRRLISGLVDRVADLENETQASIRTVGEVAKQHEAEAAKQREVLAGRVDALEAQAKAVGELAAALSRASQTTDQRLNNVEHQGKKIVQRMGELEGAAQKMAAAAGAAPSAADASPVPAPTPVERPIARQAAVIPPEIRPERHLSWGVAILLFWIAIPNLDFLGENFARFQVGSVLSRATPEHQDSTYQFGGGDFTSCLILFTISVVVLPVALRFVFSEPAAWRRALTFALCWVFACMIALFLANLVALAGGRELVYSAGYAAWLFSGMAAYLVYGLVLGATFSMLGRFYGSMSLRDTIATCGFLALSCAAVWVLCLTNLWYAPRLGLLALVSSAASAIVLAILSVSVNKLE